MVNHFLFVSFFLLLSFLCWLLGLGRKREEGGREERGAEDWFCYTLIEYLNLTKVFK